jgi:RND family efflux transporter MFP subunit
MKTRIISISVIVVIIVAIALTLANNKKKINENNKPVDRSEIPVSVAVNVAKTAPLEGGLSLPAVLEPKDQSTISIGTQGKLESLRIELGTRVSKGQVIGAIDMKVRQVELRSKELTVAKLKLDYERNKELLKGNAINETAVIESKYNYENNQLQVAQLRQQIAEANIIAPISGIITDKKMMPGEYVNPGAAIATVVDVSQLKTVVFVNEKEVYQLKLKQTASISSDVFPGKTFKGEVIYISPQGDANHNYKIEVLVKNANELKAGTYVKVDFDMKTTGDVLQIPKKALVDGIKNPYVYIVAGTKAVKQKIVIGRESGENIEVLGGLKVGDNVITDGQINVINGSNVQVKTKK